LKELVEAILNPNLSFIRYALVAGVLAGVAVGIVGTFTVARRITYIAGAISHSLLAGIGLALFCRASFNVNWFDPLYGAGLTGFWAVLLLAWISAEHKEREDTAISAIWASGMAIGLIFIAKTPGFNDPMSYLFGDILLISQKDLWLLTALDIVLVVVTVLFFNQIVGVCFDEEFARIRGIKVNRYHLLLLLLATFTVVVLVSIVGIVLVIALLALPPALAGRFTRNMTHMILLASILSMLFTTVGLVLSFLWDLPTGPVVILLTTGFYLLALPLQKASLHWLR